MVTILSLALTAESGIEHERCTSPLMCTEHAPHCAMPQPYLVPVRPTCSRITQSSGVFGSTSTLCVFPLMDKRIILGSSEVGPRVTVVPRERRRQPFRRPVGRGASGGGFGDLDL